MGRAAVTVSSTSTLATLSRRFGKLDLVGGRVDHVLDPSMVAFDAHQFTGVTPQPLLQPVESWWRLRWPDHYAARGRALWPRLTCCGRSTTKAICRRFHHR